MLSMLAAKALAAVGLFKPDSSFDENAAGSVAVAHQKVDLRQLGCAAENADGIGMPQLFLVSDAGFEQFLRRRQLREANTDVAEAFGDGAVCRFPSVLGAKLRRSPQPSRRSFVPPTCEVMVSHLITEIDPLLH